MGRGHWWWCMKYTAWKLSKQLGKCTQDLVDFSRHALITELNRSWRFQAHTVIVNLMWYLRCFFKPLRCNWIIAKVLMLQYRFYSQASICSADMLIFLQGINFNLPGCATPSRFLKAFAAVRFIQGTISDHPTSLLIDLQKNRGVTWALGMHESIRKWTKCPHKKGPLHKKKEISFFEPSIFRGYLSF